MDRKPKESLPKRGGGGAKPRPPKLKKIESTILLLINDCFRDGIKHCTDSEIIMFTSLVCSVANNEVISCLGSMVVDEVISEHYVNGPVAHESLRYSITRKGIRLIDKISIRSRSSLHSIVTKEWIQDDL